MKTHKKHKKVHQITLSHSTYTLSRNLFRSEGLKRVVSLQVRSFGRIKRGSSRGPTHVDTSGLPPPPRGRSRVRCTCVLHGAPMHPPCMRPLKKSADSLQDLLSLLMLPRCLAAALPSCGRRFCCPAILLLLLLLLLLSCEISGCSLCQQGRTVTMRRGGLLVGVTARITLPAGSEKQACMRLISHSAFRHER